MYVIYSTWLVNLEMSEYYFLYRQSDRNVNIFMLWLCSIFWSLGWPFEVLRVHGMCEWYCKTFRSTLYTIQLKCQLLPKLYALDDRHRLYGHSQSNLASCKSKANKSILLGESLNWIIPQLRLMRISMISLLTFVVDTIQIKCWLSWGHRASKPHQS